MTLVPPSLRPGDRVAVLSPSSPVLSAERLAAGVAVLRRWDLDPVVMPHAHASRGHLAGSDEQRLDDLHAAVADPTIRAVFASRGGYGATRLLDRLDWQLLARDPTWIVGFSDVTALLVAAWQRIRLVGVHGPFAGRLHALAGDGAPLRHLRALLTGQGAGLALGGTGVRTVRGGTAEGVLVGGNLSLLASLVGTPDQPDLRGAVLVVEEVNEAPYQVDRMLVQLRRAGVLAGVAGVAVGRLVACDPPGDRPSATVDEVVDAELGALGVPVVAGLPIGHVDDQLAFPVGFRARLDADGGTLHLLGPAT